jgi:hypothetical protein
MGEYYDNNGKKATDFVIGFFGFPFAAGTLMQIATLLFSLLQKTGIAINAGIVAISIYLILMVAAIVVAFKKKRRYIAIGIISNLLLVLLVFGACMAVLNGM